MYSVTNYICVRFVFYLLSFHASLFVACSLYIHYITEKNSREWMFFCSNFHTIHNHTKNNPNKKHFKQTNSPTPILSQNQLHHSIHSQPNHNKTKTSIATIQKQRKCKFDAHFTHSSANITNTIDSSFPPLNHIKPKTGKTNQTNKSKLTQQK